VGSLKKTAHLVSLGCARNRVDSELMLGSLARAGYAYSDDPATASLIVVNTCGFLGSAVEESVNTILEAARFKIEGRCKTLVVAGCLPRRYPAELAEELHEVDLLIGPDEAAQLGRMLAGEQRVCLGDLSGLPPARAPRQLTTPPGTAYLRVSEGCDRRCAFCLIPALRGSQRSRPVREIVAEARRLVGQGVVELNLVAQDLSAYGEDLPGKPRLANLLEALDSVKDLQWIRCLYLYPRRVDDRLVRALARLQRVVPYADVPVQHVSDRVLKAMRRGYDGAYARRLVERLREQVPGIALRTTVLVGHPGEGRREFDELMRFLERARFEHLGAFRYSAEHGTPAAAMERPSGRDSYNRWRKVMALGRRISRQQQRALVGQTLDVLVEGYSAETELLLEGRHAGQAPEVDGVVYVNAGQAEAGRIQPVHITRALDHDLIGELVYGE